CGKEIGFTERNIQGQQDQSIGAPVQSTLAPGKVGLAESGAVVHPAPATTTNLGNTTITANTSDNTISKSELKQIVADSTDFNDFKNRISNL
ncbi:MAG: hypothetical protein CBD74_05745, partial [Saprospirales bacterium TMED214]